MTIVGKPYACMTGVVTTIDWHDHPRKVICLCDWDCHCCSWLLTARLPTRLHFAQAVTNLTAVDALAWHHCPSAAPARSPCQPACISNSPCHCHLYPCCSYLSISIACLQQQTACSKNRRCRNAVSICNMLTVTWHMLSVTRACLLGGSQGVQSSLCPASLSIRLCFQPGKLSHLLSMQQPSLRLLLLHFLLKLALGCKQHAAVTSLFWQSATNWKLVQVAGLISNEQGAVVKCRMLVGIPFLLKGHGPINLHKKRRNVHSPSSKAILACYI